MGRDAVSYYLKKNFLLCLHFMLIAIFGTQCIGIFLFNNI